MKVANEYLKQYGGGSDDSDDDLEDDDSSDSSDDDSNVSPTESSDKKSTSSSSLSSSSSSSSSKTSNKSTSISTEPKRKIKRNHAKKQAKTQIHKPNKLMSDSVISSESINSSSYKKDSSESFGKSSDTPYLNGSDSINTSSINLVSFENKNETLKARTKNSKTKKKY